MWDLSTYCMEMSIDSLQLMVYGLSDPGLVRKNNEDVWGCLPECHLYLLADGMGGHQAGEVAAREAVIHVCSAMRAYFEKLQPNEATVTSVCAALKDAVLQANHFIYELGQTDEMLHGMGTTLTVLCFYANQAISIHVGDSRTYRLRANHLEQITQDHSLLRELINTGKFADNDAGGFPYKNILTQAVGTEDTVEPAICISQFEQGDLYLLCSDGLSDLVPREDIEKILISSHSVEEKVRYLIAAAKHKGGYDNITVVIVGATLNENIS